MINKYFAKYFGLCLIDHNFNNQRKYFKKYTYAKISLKKAQLQ